MLVVISAILGDTVGYEVGKHLGPRVMQFGIFQKHQSRLDDAQDTLRRRGGPAVFLARWTAFLRAVMPGIAGLSQMRYRVFLLWNALGGIAWGITFQPRRLLRWCLVREGRFDHRQGHGRGPRRAGDLRAGGVARAP